MSDEQTPEVPPKRGKNRGRALVPQSVKDAKGPMEHRPNGQFAPGNRGGGRPLGAKSKFAESFIENFHEAWLDGGKQALKHMAKHNPTEFVRAACALMPKDVLVDARGAGLVVVKLSDQDMEL
jgi:hypothetical protein